MTVQSHQFAQFFKELWGHDRFPWQRRLARRVCAGTWPQVIDLPTASGKTACLDVAVFAMAAQAGLPPSERTVGRRIFFVVNRRVIVDEAHERACEIARRLYDAPAGSVLRDVADALRQISGDPEAPPLDVAILRGGIYRDNRWARSITQPTIITSTIDQVGSRLLFRGYGVSQAAQPLHAALIAHDSVLFLDEAHICRPFGQTLDAVQRYRDRSWAQAPVVTPFAVVQMTATPNKATGDIFRLSIADRKHPVLAARGKSKPVLLVRAKKAKGTGSLDELAKVLVSQAERLQSGDRRTVAVIVNRVATARRVYDLLRSEQVANREVHLAIGRMRPLDRDDLTAAIQGRVSNPQPAPGDKPLFVVATQCLEVGADYDFDAMVCECASIDALRQRFGRLNRGGRDIDAKGCVVLAEDQKNSDDDPIYGPALAETWKWLISVAHDEITDFGLAAMEQLLQGVDLEPMLAPSADAPVMFPAYVDAWAQTNPHPAPDPDVSLFLHGPQHGEPDVQVCWRADLPKKVDGDVWAQIISLCPPSSPECMPVPIGVVKSWLTKQEATDALRSDLLSARAADEDTENGAIATRVGMIWRGISESRLIRSADDIRPGDTIVLPVRTGGWSVFGHVPSMHDETSATDQLDIAERAFRQSRGRAILRLTPSRVATWPANEAVTTLKTWLGDAESDLPAICDILRQIGEVLPPTFAVEAETLSTLAERRLGLVWERYPESQKGIVLTTRHPVIAHHPFLPALDDGEDETSSLARQEPVSLKNHTAHVCGVMDKTLPLLAVSSLKETLLTAARLHDMGKADERFQALLLNGDLTDAWAQPRIWAKSARLPLTTEQRRAAYRRSTLPVGFRHEMLSTQLAESVLDLPQDPVLRDLTLHLIASHHGYGRPFAPVVVDDDPPDVVLPDLAVGLTSKQRIDRPPHRLDSGIAERFWSLTRRYGWWGLAYLETALRLADQRASQLEDDGSMAIDDPSQTVEVTVCP
ncbi:MAG: type I-U CRISPR-associated helicase/endonuclease Cas3 [Phycisphaerae bacterium]|nr:type I-U CRISPR-associated helicase/endonuclease Cas3 [Phycisphaerae bacterium]